MNPSSPSTPQTTAAMVRQFLSIGAASALALTAVDLLSDGALIAPRFHRVSCYLEVSIIAFAFFFCSFLIAAPGCLAAVRLLNIRPIPSAMPIIGMLMWTQHSLTDSAPFSPSALAWAVPAVLVGGIVGWSLTLLGRREKSWVVFEQRMPVAAGAAGAGLLAFNWFIEFGGREIAKAHPIPVACGWSVFVLAIFYASYRRVATTPFQRVFACIAALCVVSFGSRPFSSDFSAIESTATQTVRPPIENVILIVVDTLRADALHTYNPEASPSSGFDGFAKNSFVFENAISAAPWTYPAMLSIMTGVLPYHDRSFGWSLIEHVRPDSDFAIRTLAEYLGDAGYYGRGILGNHLLYRPMSVTNGLADVDTYVRIGTGYSVGGKLARRLNAARYLNDSGTEILTEQAIRFLHRPATQPRFLWLHYFDPHDEYAPPLDYLPSEASESAWHHEDAATKGRSVVGRAQAKPLYDAEVRYVGDSLGRLFDEIERLGLDESSLIILTSDHGEEFWEHGEAFHGKSLYQELLHVPLMIHLPGQSEEHRIRSFVPTRSILPTILELCAIEVSDQPDWAPSLVGLMRSVSDGGGIEIPFRQPIVSSATLEGDHIVSVVLDGMKYVQHGAGEDDQLFDLASDPSEQKNIIADRLDLVAGARAAASAYQDWAAGFRARGGIPGQNEAQQSTFEDRLRSLGYIE